METQATNDRSFQQQNTMDTIAEETTTLPEGATVSILRCRTTTQTTGIRIGTYLFAAHDKFNLRMRVDNVPPAAMRQYLELMVREIHRERAKIDKLPEYKISAPDSIKDFVHNMAHLGMFIFAKELVNDVNQPRNKRIPRTRRKVPKHKGRGGNKQDIG